jgi:O-antigen/teichoic acid export membrane protein
MPHDATVGRSFLKLGAGEAIARLIAFGATVYLARRLGANGYGMIVLASAILLYMGCLTDCGVEALGVRDVAHNPAGIPGFLPSVLGGRLVVAAVLTLLLAGAGLTLFPQPEGAVVAAYAFTLLVVAMGVRWVHLGLERAGVAAAGRVLSEGLTAILILVLVRSSGDVARAPLAQIVGEGVGAIFLLILLPSYAARLVAIVRVDVVAGILRRSWPLILHALLGLVIFNSDFFFLRFYRDSASVGYYAVAYTLVSFCLNLGFSYSMSLLPVLTRLRDDAAGERLLFDDAMAQLFAGALPVAIGGFLLADRLVPLVFGDEYVPAIVPLQILLWSIPIVLFRTVAQSALIARGRQVQLLKTVAWAAATNMVLNATLIPILGLVGAAAATVLTESIRTVLALRYTQAQGLPMTSSGRFWRTLVAGGVMALAIGVVEVSNLILAGALAAGVYGLVLLLVGGIRFRRGGIPELTV